MVGRDMGNGALEATGLETDPSVMQQWGPNQSTVHQHMEKPFKNKPLQTAGAGGNKCRGENGILLRVLLLSEVKSLKTFFDGKSLFTVQGATITQI